MSTAVAIDVDDELSRRRRLRQLQQFVDVVSHHPRVGAGVECIHDVVDYLFSGGPSFASSQNCLQLAGVGSRFAKAMQATTGGGKLDLQAAVKAYQDLANAAPSAIQPDLQTISQAFATFAGALAKTGYTLGKAPTASQAAALQSAAQVFTQSKLRTAEQNIAAWAKQNCTHP